MGHDLYFEDEKDDGKYDQKQAGIIYREGLEGIKGEDETYAAYYTRKKRTRVSTDTTLPSLPINSMS